MGILLLILALAMKTLLSPVLLIYGLIRCAMIGAKNGYAVRGVIGIFVGAYLAIEDWLMELALSVDQMGNVMGMYLWNDMFRKEGGYDAGDRLDTISYFLGANKKKEKLTKLGKIASDTLGVIEENHVEKAYDIGNERLKNKLFNL